MRKGARWCGLIYGGATWENSGGIRLGDVIGEVPAASSRLSTPENELIRLGLTWAHLEHSSQLPKPATAWSAPLAHLTACCTSWLLILKRGALIAFCRRGEVPLVLVLGEMPLGMTSLRPCYVPWPTPGRPLSCPGCPYRPPVLTPECYGQGSRLGNMGRGSSSGLHCPSSNFLTPGFKLCPRFRCQAACPATTRAVWLAFRRYGSWKPIGQSWELARRSPCKPSYRIPTNLQS